MKKQKGITLVALIISIIILLILAGISIQAITNTGIFTQANNAKRESEIASIKEQIALDIYEKQLVPPLGSITEEQLETILGKYGTVNKEDGTIVGITTAKGYEILLKDIYGGETVAESVPDGAIVNPVNDITTWLKTGEISKQYSYTTIEQVIADNTCTESLMNNENAMKYLARSTEFAEAICASETTMTYLGQSAYVDDTVLNSDIWINYIYDSQYFEHIFSKLIPTLCQDDSHIITNGSNYVRDVAPLWRLFDNDSNTVYQMYDVNSTSFTSGKYVGYSFDDTVTIRRIYFEFSTNCSVEGGHQTKSIQISEDGTNFNTIKSIPITHMQVLDEPFVIINSTYNIKAIRIYVESGAYAHSLNDYELQVYGR